MRSQSSGASGRAAKLNRIWILGIFVALLPWIAAVAEGQETEPGQVEPRTTEPKETHPGDSGLGPAAPWSVEGRPEPGGQRPKTDRERQREKLDELHRKNDKRPRRCKILEVHNLGRLYVDDVSGHAAGFPYWVQLPPNVRLVAEDPRQFDGRKRLKLEDLEVGQLLFITVKASDGEILKVKVRAAKKPPPAPAPAPPEAEEPPPPA